MKFHPNLFTSLALACALQAASIGQALAAPAGFSRGMNTELIFTKMSNGQCVLDTNADRPKTNMFPDFDDTTQTNPRLNKLLSRKIDHLRLPIEFHFLYKAPTAGNTSLLQATNLNFLVSYINRANAAGMNIIVDLHVARYACGRDYGDTYSQYIEQKKLPDSEEDDPADANAVLLRRQTFIDFWKELASQLSARTNAGKVMLEPMNEPRFEGEGKPELWNAYQTRLLNAIRSSAPNHRVILTGSYWSNIDALAGLSGVENGRGPFPVMQPYRDALGNPDAKVVYNFHYYEPFVFTHQGAEWDSFYGALQALPFPPSDSNMTAILQANKGKPVYGELKMYTNDWQQPGNNPTTQRLGKFVNWANSFNIPNTQWIATEFGAYPEKIDHASFMAYTRDTSKQLTGNQIGWSWYYGQSYTPNNAVISDWPYDAGITDADYWIIFRNDVNCALRDQWRLCVSGRFGALEGPIN